TCARGEKMPPTVLSSRWSTVKALNPAPKRPKKAGVSNPPNTTKGNASPPLFGARHPSHAPQRPATGPGPRRPRLNNTIEPRRPYPPSGRPVAEKTPPSTGNPQRSPAKGEGGSGLAATSTCGRGGSAGRTGTATCPGGSGP